MKVKTRFLNYIHFVTTSNENATCSPSTKGQLILGEFLANELKSLGLSKVKIDENGYVYGLLPATLGRESDMPIGFIAHMDTSPDFSGESIEAQIIKNYNGEDVILGTSGKTLKVDEFKHLKNLKDSTLITTDGTTLLGADDKAGIAEIITAIEELITEHTPHGDIWIGFTPDEEIGRGAHKFDLHYFKAKYAYTVDGGYEGELSYENFNAASAKFLITGKSVHPGSAKGIMKNGGLIASEIAMSLPLNETPAHTEGREGFYHITNICGDVSKAELNLIVRGHDKEKFLARKRFLNDIVQKFNEKYGDGSVRLEWKDSYANMKDVIEKVPYVIERAKNAMLKAHVIPESSPIRGSTDGATLSFMGLPTPNIGTGGYGFHGPFEHITVEAMERVVQIIKNIAIG